MGSFIYSLFPRLISSISCKPHEKFQLSSLLTLFLKWLTNSKKNCIPLKNDTEISDKVAHTPYLATLTTLRHQDRVRKTPGEGGGGTPLQEANGDVPRDGVAFSRLEWL